PLAPEWARRSVGRLSPTRLERFATCPFRYFAEEVLRVLPPDDAADGEDLSPREIGTLTHALLEELYGRLAARDFERDQLDAELAAAATTVAAAFERRAHVPLRGILAARFAEVVRAVATEAVFQFVDEYLRGDPSVDEIREERLTRRFLATDWTGCRDDVEQAVADFATFIRDGWFFVRVADEQGGHCTYCDFGWICRKNHGRVRRKPEWTPAVTRYWEIVRP